MEGGDLLNAGNNGGEKEGEGKEEEERNLLEQMAELLQFCHLRPEDVVPTGEQRDDIKLIH